MCSVSNCNIIMMTIWEFHQFILLCSNWIRITVLPPSFLPSSPSQQPSLEPLPYDYSMLKLIVILLLLQMHTFICIHTQLVVPVFFLVLVVVCVWLQSWPSSTLYCKTNKGVHLWESLILLFSALITSISRVWSYEISPLLH